MPSARVLLIALTGLLAACTERAAESPVEPSAGEIDPMTLRRWKMVEEQIAARGVEDERVLAAMRKVERHRFVPDSLQGAAYRDGALPIGLDQTISQPYIVASMTELAAVGAGDKVLEVGTGSGYQAAVLAELAAEVFTIEILPELGRRARAMLESLGADNVRFRIGDGYAGWPEEAPFDAIVVTAAPEEVPQPLIDQLAEGGRLVIPVGGRDQELRLLTRRDGRIEERRVFPVSFVPMTGRAQEDG